MARLQWRRSVLPNPLRLCLKHSLLLSMSVTQTSKKKHIYTRYVFTRELNYCAVFPHGVNVSHKLPLGDHHQGRQFLRTRKVNSDQSPGVMARQLKCLDTSGILLNSNRSKPSWDLNIEQQNKKYLPLLSRASPLR